MFWGVWGVFGGFGGFAFRAPKLQGFGLLERVRCRLRLGTLNPKPLNPHKPLNP